MRAVMMLSAVMFFVSTPVFGEIPFVSEIVDSGDLTGFSSSLAFDKEGNPHISYYDFTNNDLKYAVKRNGSWTTEIVWSTGVVGAYSSLALDSYDNPHIVCYNGSTGDLLYAVNYGVTWSVEAVDTSGDVGWYPSIQVDTQGRPHISYFDQTNLRLKYATKNPGWVVTVVDESAAVGWDTSLKLDNQGYPHISYYDITNAKLKYAHKTSTGWMVETASAFNNVGQYTSLALDAKGLPHISCYDSYSDDVMYWVKYAQGVWGWDRVEETLGGIFTSIALDANGMAHVTWHDEYFGLVMHAARLADSVWETGVVAYQPGNQATSLALDSNQIPHVSYFSGSNGMLALADAGVHLSSPIPADTWPVGSRRMISWRGGGEVDILLSVDGGASYAALAEHLASHADGSTTHYTLTVPHIPSRYCKIRLERASYYSSAESDSFFTIDASIALLALKARPGEQGQGTELSWSTSPGPEDLAGYRLEKTTAEGERRVVVSSTQETHYTDLDAASGDRYSLIAINGLGEEFRLGETSAALTLADGEILRVFPNPLRETATVFFRIPADRSFDLSVYDVLGRRVTTLDPGIVAGGVESVIWDRRSDAGRSVPPGVYFVRLDTPGRQQIRRITVIR